MRTKHRQLALWFVLIPLLALAYKPEEITSIQYTYMGSSTPPQYHRSYVIVVTPDSVKMTVDSYGKVLAEKQDPITGEQFNKLMEIINESHLEESAEADRKGCAGGTGEGILLLKDKEQVFSGNMYHCGGRAFGDFKGDLRPVLEAMKKLIPEFDQLLSSPYK